MDIKQVIIVVRAPAGAKRVVYGSNGEVVSGDEEAVQDLFCPEATLTVAVRGKKGESLSAVLDGEGNCVSGDKASVADSLKGFPNERIASIAGLLTAPHEERLLYEKPAVVSSTPAPLPGVDTEKSGASEGAGVVSEGDSDRDPGDNVE